MLSRSSYFHIFEILGGDSAVNPPVIEMIKFGDRNRMVHSYAMYEKYCLDSPAVTHLICKLIITFIFDYSLEKVWVARNPPGFAFVEFKDPRDADDAIRDLDGKYVVGTKNSQ